MKSSMNVSLATVESFELAVISDRSPSAQAETRRFLPGLWLSGGLALAGMVCLVFVDFPIGHYFKTHPLHGDLADAVDATEHFGTPFGQLLILGTILTISRGRISWTGRVFWGTCAAGLAAGLVKLLIARTRPRAFEFFTLSITDSFTGFFPLGTGGALAQSFPSAHTASAFGFAALMSWACPTGRPAFLLLAALCGLHRICTQAHFPSDVCFGAALGWFVGSLFVSWPPLSRPFDRMEAWWRRRFSAGQVRADRA
jgi:membrane-associated phospholipid phosphatase